MVFINFQNLWVHLEVVGARLGKIYRFATVGSTPPFKFYEGANTKLHKLHCYQSGWGVNTQLLNGEDEFFFEISVLQIYFRAIFQVECLILYSPLS